MDWEQGSAAFDAAQNLLQRADRQQPDFADAKAELGWVLLRKVTEQDDPDDERDYTAAKRLIAQALALSPHNARGLAAHARVLQADGQCPQAVAVAQTVLGLYASNIDALGVLASCALSAMQLDDAAGLYERILRLDPYAPANKIRYLALGTIRLMQGRYNDAVTLLEKCQDTGISPPAGMGVEEQARLLLMAATALTGNLALARTEYAAYDQAFPRRTAWRIGAYFPTLWHQHPGLQNILAALQSAGMPRLANEHFRGADAGACDDGATSGDFAPTPAALPGGETYDTAHVQSVLSSPQTPLVIDVGRGIGAAPSWRLYDPSKDETAPAFAVRIASEAAAGGRQQPILVVGDGIAGCTSFRAARSLIAAGYAHVAWYRGGEEAWSAREQGAGAHSVSAAAAIPKP